MTDIKKDVDGRVDWIRSVLSGAKADGVVFGASGGKDSALTGVLCRLATPSVTGIIMPCESRRNYGIDRRHALLLAELYDIKTLELDLTPIKKQFAAALYALCDKQSDMAYANINPRLRMTALYNYAQRNNYLVAGCGNRSELTMGYFTKWGDGAHDFNPIADLTVTEVYERLRYLGVPSEIIDEPPSGGLYDGQTDEAELGITYKEIDAYLLDNTASDDARRTIEEAHARTAHKRQPIKVYKSF